MLRQRGDHASRLAPKEMILPHLASSNSAAAGTRSHATTLERHLLWRATRWSAASWTAAWQLATKPIRSRAITNSFGTGYSIPQNLIWRPKKGAEASSLSVVEKRRREIPSL